MTAVAVPAGETVRALLALLAVHQPRDQSERLSVRRTVALLDWLPEPLDQDADPTHVTGSAIVLDRRRPVVAAPCGQARATRVPTA